MKEFTREELQEICSRADERSDEVKNEFWKEAYFKLAIAANTLDAMEARTEEKTEEPA